MAYRGARIPREGEEHAKAKAKAEEEDFRTVFADIDELLRRSRKRKKSQEVRHSGDVVVGLQVSSSLIDLEVDFMTAVQGTKESLAYERIELCKDCGGAGGVTSQCSTCKGSGFLVVRRRGAVYSFPCEHCEGTGTFVKHKCE